MNAPEKAADVLVQGVDTGGRYRFDSVGTNCFNNMALRAWLDRITGQIAKRVEGMSPQWRMYSYERGSGTLLAIDAFTENTKSDISITIAVTPGEVEVSDFIEGQLDICLPSIRDAFEFATHLLGDKSGLIRISKWAHPT